MKLVNVGDILLDPEYMAAAAKGFSRYDVIQNFYFGPRNKEDFRHFQTAMEREGYRCAPVPDEILAQISDADVLQVHMMPVPEKVFQAGKKLKIICSNRGGSENLDLEAAARYGVAVLCNPAHNANAVAEYTIGMMLSEVRNIARCHAAFVRYKSWREASPNSGQIYEMSGMTVGIVGFGTIGRLLSEKLSKGFGTQVIAFDPYVDEAAMAAHAACKVGLSQLLRQADIVTLHMRVTPQTRRMIGRREFSLMKPTAVLVNTGRSGVVDSGAMVEALQSERIMGAALDIFDHEPLPQDSPLLALDNVTLTTHQGGVTVNAFRDSPQMVLWECERFFSGERPRFLKTPLSP